MTTIDRTNLTIRQTSPRMTPPPVSRQFSAVLARGGEALLQGAVAAAQFVPGGSILAAAVRGAGVSFTSGGNSQATASYGTVESPQPGLGNGASGPGGSTDASAPVSGTGSSPSLGSSGSSSTGDAQNNDMLARSQEMSMKMLQLQEAMGEENRRYTALSNVLHARQEMAKNAIGNIR